MLITNDVLNKWEIDRKDKKLNGHCKTCEFLDNEIYCNQTCNLFPPNKATPVAKHCKQPATKKSFNDDVMGKIPYEDEG